MTIVKIPTDMYTSDIRSNTIPFSTHSSKIISINAKKTEQCKLLGPYSLIFQCLLGILAVSSLVIKRYKEYPNRRPWRIWFFDVSKQVFGALGVHFLNVFLSVISGGEFFSILLRALSDDNDGGDGDDESPCDYYFINILFDTTIGIPLLWASLYLIIGICRKLNIKGIESG